jgi:hypothetical protein
MIPIGVGGTTIVGVANDDTVRIAVITFRIAYFLSRKGFNLSLLPLASLMC